MNTILKITKISSIIIALFIVCAFTVALIDYYHVKHLEKPQFCIENKIIEYDDGVVEVCSGVGYKIIEYHRTSFEAVQFGGPWIKVKTDFSKYKK